MYYYIIIIIKIAYCFDSIWGCTSGVSPLPTFTASVWIHMAVRSIYCIRVGYTWQYAAPGFNNIIKKLWAARLENSTPRPNASISAMRPQVTIC